MRRVNIEVFSDVGNTSWSISTSSKDDALKFWRFIASLDEDDDVFCPDAFSSPVEVDMDLVREIEKGRIDV